MGRRTYKISVENTNKVQIWNLNLCTKNKQVAKKSWPDCVAYFQYNDLGTDFAGEKCEVIKINYRLKNKTDETIVTVTTSKCYFGGFRYWFKCPHCNKRVGTLYAVHGYFACRVCHGLTYQSTNANRRYKLYLYQQLIEKQKRIQSLRSRRLFYSGTPTKLKVKMDKLSRQIQSLQNL
jgi:hypothetical protein